MQPISKTEQAINLYKSGELQKALRIFKTFKMGLTKEESSIIKTAAELSAGTSTLYLQMGINKDLLTNQAKEIIERKFIK